jgi:GntR family transcriptional regulator, transcriptional repressor for pyruvate dehydrogenase complex
MKSGVTGSSAHLTRRATEQPAADGNRLTARSLRPTLSDYVTEQLLDLIKGEEEGSRLPSVVALARSLSVAAPTVRESLRRLEALGVVEIRHGSGVYVRNTGARVLLANPYSGQLEARTVLELLDARLVIEPTLANRTAVNASGGEIRELGRILEEAAELLDGHDPLLHGVNMAFHRGVARFSGNAVLAQTIDSIVDLYTAEQLLILRLYDNRARDHDEHLAIFGAISRRDSVGAAELMRKHLEDVLQVMEDRLGEAGAAHAAQRGAARGKGVGLSGR